MPEALRFVELGSEERKAVALAAAARAKNNILITAFSNQGYLPFLRNLVCSLTRLQLHNYLIIAWDNATCPAAGLANSTCVHPYHERIGGIVTATHGIATYRSQAFNRMVLQKPLWVQWLLRVGFEVLLADLDTVWLHDPQPLLRALRVLRAAKPPYRESCCTGRVGACRPGCTSVSVYEHPVAFPPLAGSALTRLALTPVKKQALTAARRRSAARSALVPDIVFQSEHAHGVNSGLFFARPTNASLRLVGAWIERLAELLETAAFEEQWALNTALLRLKHAGADIAYGVLEDERFPNGKIWCAALPNSRVGIGSGAESPKQSHDAAPDGCKMWLSDVFNLYLQRYVCETKGRRVRGPVVRPRAS